mgnify:FL=1
MKTRIIMITTILAMACIVWLVGENRAYKALVNEQRIKEAELLNQMFDMQVEYDILLDEAIRLEDETQILGSMIGEMENLVDEKNK